jgi:hypothetical protein
VFLRIVKNPRTIVPAILYRYRSLSGDAFKHTQDIFLRRRLYLPKSESLNDPCEGFCRADRSEGVSLDKPGCYSAGVGGLVVVNTPKGSRVGAFTSLNSHPLMWAHYANCHFGICLGFWTDKVPLLKRARPIQYRPDIPLLKPDMLQDAFFYKSADWAYECEWRVISNNEFKEYLPLSTESLAHVVLGQRISKEDREWVRDWVKIFGGNIEILQAAFSEDQYIMDIEPGSFSKD